MAFFRDPERRVPADPDVMVSPADGLVVETVELDHHPDINGPAKRISIFLSVFDVHINRSPCEGVVRMMRYQPGQFVDARDPDSGRVNEANTIVIEPDDPAEGPVVVRQIAGLIARRIVCDLKVGDRVRTGQRIGLIKFGSRTELIFPAGSRFLPSVPCGGSRQGGCDHHGSQADGPGSWRAARKLEALARRSQWASNWGVQLRCSSYCPEMVAGNPPFVHDGAGGPMLCHCE
jgi:phosphatidylserine decarboxylase